MDSDLVASAVNRSILGKLMPKPYILPNGIDAADVCTWCKLGQHDECDTFWEDGAGDTCCCDGAYDKVKHFAQLAGYSEDEAPKREKTSPVGDNPVEKLEGWGTLELLPNGKTRGDSGYIHPLAWPSTRDIGTLREPKSTGRKRVADMYPIPKGKICEWAGLAAAGGGIFPIVGCVGYPATDLHHGPDKNTLNNMRASAGTSDGAENVHQICAFCHNAWHGANDPTYPERDYVEDQATPWLPQDGEIREHDPDTRADHETLYAVDALRRADKDRRTGGRKDWEDDGPDLDELFGADDE